MLEVERVRDSFHHAVFTVPDVDEAMRAITADCVLLHLPMGTGASSRDGLRRYLATDVLPHLPAALSFRRVSRTVDRWRVAEEAMVGFTHDRELPWLLPDVAPTHRRAEVLAISVVTVQRARITAHRTLWDHAGLCEQLHIDPSAVATTNNKAGASR